MNRYLKEIISNSAFSLQDGRYCYAKVATAPAGGGHFFISQDKDEITVVTREEKLSSLDLLEQNKDYYCLVALNVSVPFYSVGFLAAVSGAIAEEGLNILIISTYSKDYIMVRDDKWEEAKNVLRGLGFREEG